MQKVVCNRSHCRPAGHLRPVAYPDDPATARYRTDLRAVGEGRGDHPSGRGRKAAVVCAKQRQPQAAGDSSAARRESGNTGTRCLSCAGEAQPLLRSCATTSSALCHRRWCGCLDRVHSCLYVRSQRACRKGRIALLQTRHGAGLPLSTATARREQKSRTLSARQTLRPSSLTVSRCAARPTLLRATSAPSR